ncbi:MAG: ABC transporter substrate-binding protein [Spirochaetia bacterium]|jgi:iron(III) transport system substrate-binding protein|nr:ABC transporter substrate-binding protein [Spirochaetia bacterium]
MIRKLLLFVFIGMIALTPVYSGGKKERPAPAASGQGYPAEVEEWLKEVKLGPWQEKEVSYDALYEAAKKEGKMIVYAGTSRMGRVADAFMEKYPGLKVEAEMMGTAEVIEKYVREARAGLHRADVVQASQAGRQKSLLYDRNSLFSWTPPDLDGVLTSEQKESFVHWRYGSRQWIYNDTVSKGEPFTSLWELTEPKWNKRVAIGDPRLDGGTLDYFITIVLRADEMAADYKKLYGKEITLTTPNAGYEWIKMLLNNDPIIVKSEKDVQPIVGERGLKNAPVGLVAGSRFRDVGNPAKGDLRFFPTLNTTPAIGVLNIYIAGITYKSANPNTAKLFIRFLYGDEQGGGGFAPFHEPGNWPARSDVTAKPEIEFAPDIADVMWPLSKLNFWMMEEEKVYNLQEVVLDFLTDTLF